jgi:NAD(P)-dependent dehydrogenase (short-subunit alcohol dehydrogenase family)
LQFATNHLGHFRLALGLLPALRAAGGARVVSVRSRAHLNSPVIFDDIDFRDRPYDPALAYAQSKTANVLFAVAAARHWSDDGIEVNALHPGAIADSNLARYYKPAELDALRSSGRYTFKTLTQGEVATSVYVATSPRLNGVVGRYFENCQERLWAVSEQMNQ